MRNDDSSGLVSTFLWFTQSPTSTLKLQCVYSMYSVENRIMDWGGSILQSYSGTCPGEEINQNKLRLKWILVSLLKCGVCCKPETKP